MHRRRRKAALAPLALLLLATGCGGGAPSRSGVPGAGGVLPGAELTVVAYSTPQQAYDRIIDAFRATPAGRNVRFVRSYGSSGDQSRAVESGLDADVVALALERDVERLVEAGIVASDWNTDQYKGMATKSVVVFAVRKGNPGGVDAWDDLVRPGVEVITPNPFTSGGARWNVMAAYGQAAAGGTEADGVRYLEKLFANVPVQDHTARKSLQTFVAGKGDVLLAYENEAIFARRKGQPIEYVVPDSTILIENPVAVTRTSKHPRQARAFLDFLRGPLAQRIFAENGYRPVVDGVASPYRFPLPERLFEIADFGGWSEVSRKFFDPDDGVMARVERRIGVSVG